MKKVDMKKSVELSNSENEELHKGSRRDRINLLSLLAEKDPSQENQKNLNLYIKIKRVMYFYFTLRDMKDLLITKGDPENYYIKQKVIKCFEIYVRNVSLKTKALKLVYESLKNNVLHDGLIHACIVEIGYKKEIE